MPWSALSRATENASGGGHHHCFPCRNRARLFGLRIFASRHHRPVAPLRPAEIIPSIFLLEIAASIHLLPGIWRDIHWRSLIPLVVGTAIGTPFGVMFLANVPAAPMQIALVPVRVRVTCLLWLGFALKTMPGTCQHCSPVCSRRCKWRLWHRRSARHPVLFRLAGRKHRRPRIACRLFPADRRHRLGIPRARKSGDHRSLSRTLIIPACPRCRRLARRPEFQECRSVVFRKWVLALLVLLAVITAAKGVIRSL